MHMFGNYGAMGYGGGMIFMFLLWGLVIALILSVFRRSSKSYSPVEKRTALDIAQERFASRDITKLEFDRLKHDFR